MPKSKQITFVDPITHATITGTEFPQRKPSSAARRKRALLRHVSKNPKAWVVSRIHPITRNLEEYLDGFGFARDLMGAA